MNIYIPINNESRDIVPARPQLMPNPSEAPRKVEIWVSVDSNRRHTKEWLCAHIDWHLVYDGVGAALETRLGMNLFSFRILKGKYRPFVGKYILLDRRGYGKREVRLLAEHLRHSIPVA